MDLLDIIMSIAVLLAIIGLAFTLRESRDD